MKANKPSFSVVLIFCLFAIMLTGFMKEIPAANMEKDGINVRILKTIIDSLNKRIQFQGGIWLVSDSFTPPITIPHLPYTKIWESVPEKELPNDPVYIMELISKGQNCHFYRVGEKGYFEDYFCRKNAHFLNWRDSMSLKGEKVNGYLEHINLMKLSSGVYVVLIQFFNENGGGAGYVFIVKESEHAIKILLAEETWTT